MRTGIIFSIEEFAINDGPGIRTTVFLKGCPLRCAWCHNPEGLSVQPQWLDKKGRKELCGYEISAEELASRLLRDKDLFRDSGGGVTFTGGEPLTQVDFLCEVMDLLPQVHKAVETSAFVSAETFRKALGHVDLVLMDIKLVNPELHRRYTGVDNSAILENLRIVNFAANIAII